MNHHTLFVEKRPPFASEAQHLLHDLREALDLAEISSLRLLNRYDIIGVSDSEFAAASASILSEPQADTTSAALEISDQETAFAYSYLPGQFDQRADSAAQCIQILTGKEKPEVTSSRIVILTGKLSQTDLEAIKSYIINPVDSHEVVAADFIRHAKSTPPEDIEILENFLTASSESIRKDMSLAMSEADIAFTQDYFKNEENRAPSLTEIRMLDTYWSDHCRHTTFLTAIDDVKFAPGTEVIEETYGIYRSVRQKLGRDEKPVTLMDIALIGMRELKASGELDNLEVSEEINAASIVVKVQISNSNSQKDSVAESSLGELGDLAVQNSFEEEWLVQFKNETHNHPTEIEPFGGAATCLGGCIRDPLSGRSYVYQAMRVTGAADPLTPFSETLPGKLPQKKICQVAAKGYSSYGNQIGLATGQVAEVYHPGYVAKRLEIGAVVAAAPRSNVFRGSPSPGDVIMLIGGRTGRDGVGGATGSSKEHTETALENSAEVQKGDAPTERKVQRLFRNPELTRKIKICNDFGAGGVSVAIGEIAPSLVINLDAVPKKYDGLDGTELAISESQERMAVCIDPSEIDYFIAESDKENLECVHVADVTDSGRLIITWRDKEIVNFSRAFLDTNGVQQTAAVIVEESQPKSSTYHCPLITDHLRSLNVCSQKGLGEMFDGSVGANTVLWPFGGKHQITPPDAMVAKLPLLEGETDHATYMSWGFDPHLSEKSPFLGAAYAVTESVCKAVAAGARLPDIRLTLQEYFPRLGNDPKRWGLPFAALLGAFRAQHELRLAAIGGKDSMSGSFNELDVPPTLVSFALAPGLASLAISPEFKRSDSIVSLIEIPALENGLPDFPAIMDTAEAIHLLNKAGKLLAVHHIGSPGLAAALTKMSLGNHIGFVAADCIPQADPYSPKYFSFLIEHSQGEADAIRQHLPSSIEIGTTIPEATFSIGTETHNLSDLQAAFEGTLEPVYPTKPESSGEQQPVVIPQPKSSKSTIRNPQSSIPKPKVLIPSFPGTNSEYDSARSFDRIGAETHIEVFRNLTASHIEESIIALAEQIASSQILFIPGGFSAGDEPDGSAKFIATILRNPRISDAISDLLANRDGLILGICNGFQALIKTGLATHGRVIETGTDSATLVHNDISRHISQYVRTRVANNSSPWLSGMEIGDIHTVPVSHGEGKFFAPPEVIAALAENGQIATQYCDASGNPTMLHPFNPNGSLAAIEGITSPCGRVFGKMAHSERFSEKVAKNIPGNKDQPIFLAGLKYFK
ncbi:MAG: phosphoribosylformylglycinamidine synthase [Akkermansiaceae bacterium]|nr:phosphoribosylformylglycinamidine synthase [Akkermansiaceae bacterium]MDP4646912.1 phosphoribosylformylglycinamidine synthase [Akkermansiaceae bacterium]MDP4722356.1 phosphoribosylformylglycinamidine synthase [Akkermansiaceae bacterium]MDP4781244.1 phosphoribosylformylglycinamidine synthase [Akkermansiaceae bacterium]MDP4847880.1 phosphoribosylformylglycinamidine synthase [Akkermansiaceae bacterium]